jgi:hypothetical protein
MRDDLNMPAAACGFALGTCHWGYSIFELRYADAKAEG